MPSPPDPHRPTPRKSPRQARSVETVRAIVEAAARILEQKGLGGFTTNAVADRAGVSIGSLYQYFPSKEALVGALIVRETSALIEEWEGAVAQHDGRDALSHMITAAVSHQLRRPALARLLDVEEARLPFDPARQTVLDRLCDILIDVLSRATFGPTQRVPIMAQDVLAIIRGMVDAAGERSEDDRADLAARVSRAVFGYLGQGA